MHPGVVGVVTETGSKSTTQGMGEGVVRAREKKKGPMSQTR